MKRRNILVPSKAEYVKGKKPEVDCILCALAEHKAEIPDTIVWEGEDFLIALNLYPYNPGHIMIFPRIHVTTLFELSHTNIERFFYLTEKSEFVLNELYSPCGLNIGFNIGECSGASISHIHLHIVPRYKNELSFMDVLSGSKVIVEDPVLSKEKLKKAFSNIL